MWFSSWLGKRQRPALNGRSRSPRKRTSYRPHLEPLEDRWLPSQIGLTVTSLADSGAGTLRAAIQTADAGTHSDKFTIGFAVTGTIDLQSPLPDLDNAITLQGPGAASLTVERASGVSFAAAILTVDAGQTATLAGLTIANGNAGGIVNNGGALTISQSIVTGNSAYNGGGIDNFSGTLAINASSLLDNSARTDGGGIFNYGTLTISGSSLSGNSAGSFGGGAIFNFITGAMSISGSTLSGNSAPLGGAIWDAGTSTTISGCTVAGNSATGIHLNNGFVLAAEGGGIREEGSLNISTSTIADNTALSALSIGAAGGGGGIFNDDGMVTVASSTVSGNVADFGGGVASAGTMTVRDSLLSSNSASLGAGIYNYGNAVTFSLDIRGSTFSANTASDSGGGIYNLGTATLQECTLSGNTAANDGGGIFNGASGTLTIDDSTVCDNFAALGADLYNLGVATINDSDVCVIGP
jgi:predicted outer membrane repeat protein